MDKFIKVTPLGGCGEIGMNMTLIQTPDDKTFIVDCGALFADPSLYGVRMIVPAVQYLEKNNIKPDAWLITHGHEDHIGALPYLFEKFRAPIYSTKFTLALIKAKLEQYFIKDIDYCEWTPFRTTFFPSLSVTPFYVNHSIPESTGILIESPSGNILHMGDFRIDETLPDLHSTPQSIRKVLSGKQVHLMMSDSTNSFKEGRDSNEGDILPEISKIMQEQKGAVIVTTFSSNIWRMKTILKAARKHNRTVFLFGRSMNKNFAVSKELGIIDEIDAKIVCEDISKIKKYKKSEICIVCTGSQGEVYSGLHNLSSQKNRDFSLGEGDLVIFSARTIPGNERTIDELLNKLAKLGCQAIHGYTENTIHVSGHGYKGDLEECIKITKPKFFMPVHGTFRHLKQHAQIATESGIPKENCIVVENGFSLSFNKEKAFLGESVPSGRLYLCQGGLFHPGHPIYKTRLLMGETGLVLVTLILDGNSLRTLCAPIVVTKGVPIQARDLIQETNSAIRRIIKTENKNLKQRNDEGLAEHLRKVLMKKIFDVCEYKCPVSIVIQRINNAPYKGSSRDPLDSQSSQRDREPQESGELQDNSDNSSRGYQRGSAPRPATREPYKGRPKGPMGS